GGYCMSTAKRSARAERTPARTAASILDPLAIEAINPGAWAEHPIATTGPTLASIDPATGDQIASVRLATADEYHQVARAAHDAFLEWREWPAPRRGEVVRQLAARLREHQDALGRLVTLEVGKISTE